jgi:hypothetical protein
MNIESPFNPDDIKVRIYEIDNSFMGIKEQEHSYVTAELLLRIIKLEISFR